METKTATERFAALSQPTRLEAFRLLMRHEPEGLPAGAIARELDVPHNTLSSHLAILAQAGWVVSQRQGRSIVYRASLDCMRETLEFLMRDCCQGRPEVCDPLLTALGACLPSTDPHTENRE